MPDNKILGNQIPEGATVVVDIQKVITGRKIGSRGNNDSPRFNNGILPSKIFFQKEPWWLPNIHIPCIEVEGIKVGSWFVPVMSIIVLE